MPRENACLRISPSICRPVRNVVPSGVRCGLRVPGISCHFFLPCFCICSFNCCIAVTYSKEWSGWDSLVPAHPYILWFLCCHTGVFPAPFVASELYFPAGLFMPTWGSSFALTEPIICTDMLLTYLQLCVTIRWAVGYIVCVCSRNQKSQEEYKYLLPVM